MIPQGPFQTFKPRPSLGWLSLVLLPVPFIALGLWFLLLGDPRMPLWIRLFNGIVCTGIGLPMLYLALWFPAMRYELGPAELILRYGPALTYRIPLSGITRIRRRNLAISLWSSMRLPGLALFKVPYSDVGTVRMCATSASRHILLIEAGDATYGLTPVDEERFVAELKSRMGA